MISRKYIANCIEGRKGAKRDEKGREGAKRDEKESDNNFMNEFVVFIRIAHESKLEIKLVTFHSGRCQVPLESKTDVWSTRRR